MKQPDTLNREYFQAVKRTRMAQITGAVLTELERAVEKHRPMNSAHESYAVILEELDEFWEVVREKDPMQHKDEVAKELIQTAAMCCRAILDLELDEEWPEE